MERGLADAEDRRDLVDSHAARLEHVANGRLDELVVGVAAVRTRDANQLVALPHERLSGEPRRQLGHEGDQRLLPVHDRREALAHSPRVHLAQVQGLQRRCLLKGKESRRFGTHLWHT